MYATGSESIAKGYILLMLGIPIYLYLRWRRQRDRLPLGTELLEIQTLESVQGVRREDALARSWSSVDV
jgi:hypothetical protein